MKSPAYLKFVRSLPCVICETPEVEAHHLIGHGQGGMGMKSSDRYAMPLCSMHHRQLHDGGWKTWENTYGAQPMFALQTMDAWTDSLEAENARLKQEIQRLRGIVKAFRETA